MDKDMMKRLLRDHDIPICQSVTLRKEDSHTMSYEEIGRMLGSVLFVKPANLGSSVGISRVTNGEDFVKAIDLAFSFDSKIVVEEEVKGREIECAVLGNEEPRASIPGEIIPTSAFYSYVAKYLDEQGATLSIPAKLSEELIVKIQELAIKTFKALECKGMARADFFLLEDGSIFVNEINTIPGFTKISMYPKLWEQSGIPYPDLIDKLIQLAILDFQKQSKLKTGVEL